MIARTFLFTLLLAAPLSAQSLSDRIGVAHAGGKYTLGDDDRDFLSEGAHRIRYDLGSRVIKLWLTRRPASLYAFRSPEWKETPYEQDMVTVASHPYYRGVFEMPFTTFILVVDSPDEVWFGDGMKREEQEAEERVFYDLTRYLLETYAGSGKTFVLQNWEADWLLHLDTTASGLGPDAEPRVSAITGMIAWMTARQRGVERARADLAGLSDVTVKHAIEVNHVWRAKYEPWRASVTRDVLPWVSADMYSYSAWETAGDATGALLKEMLTHLDERTEGSGNIYVGEYGIPENDYGTEEHRDRVRAFTLAALEWGAPYVIYWQIFCNEFAASATEVVGNDDVRGFWLMRPDGSYAPAWSVLRNLITPRVRAARR